MTAVGTTHEATSRGRTRAHALAVAIAASLDRRFWLMTLVGSVVAAAILGIPTAVIPNPWFTRMLPTEPINVLVLVGSVPLMGLLIATYLAPGPFANDAHAPRSSVGPSVASIGSYLAIGCPICNKIIVAVLGASGAVNAFAPLQPLIGSASIVLLGATLAWRLRRRALGCAACSGLPRLSTGASERG